MIARIALLVPLALAGCASASAPEPERRTSETQHSALSCAQESARLRALLRRPHDPPGLDEVARLCNDALPALRAVAQDRRGYGVERSRALELLGRSHGAAPELLSALALERVEPASIRRASLAALGRCAKGEVVLTTATQALSDVDPHVRAAAASVLGGLETPAARSALESARERESEPFVRKALERALERRAPR